MKKTIEIEQSFCDVCEKESGFSYKCLSCGREFCYDCVKLYAVKYSHAVYFGGSGDGVYCKACDEKLPTTGDKIHAAYRKILSLKNEQIGFYKDFKERCDIAEAELQYLQGRPR